VFFQFCSICVIGSSEGSGVVVLNSLSKIYDFIVVKYSFGIQSLWLLS